ncbi:Stk1 family PASTA domain-containing Ser/Thr kinase [Eupransor demetentiae]|uniref:non-specific serine/threonine protein kinase n=1 Tax=Eupransor demetentiae TaxID=3109584 RepID=A0ABM9N4W1_9LACO|nr:PASTA domain [Lactobacillaceae bacterium LMG 33000]
MQAGTVIDGRYQIVRPLGGGGMANVYLAHDQYLDRDVTLKIMRLDLQGRKDLEERFQREAKAATALVNDHIVQAYDVGQYDGSNYLVMEYVDGTDLKDYINQNFPIPYREIVDIMRQILEAVQVAHQAGIIHRDLKPQNVLIDTHGQVKITDFGIAMAKESQDLTQTNTVIGSVHYISPEQTRGEGASVKSDIYALGVILYQMLTNRVPYEGETAASVALKHATMPMPSVRDFDPDVPQALENVVLKATAKDPADRYDSAEEMSDDLKTVLSPRRANEEPFVAANHDDETRIMPTTNPADLQDKGDREDQPSSVVSDIIDYGRKGYSVKKIAQLVDRTPKYVRKTLKANGIKYHDPKRWLIAIGALLVLLGLIFGIAKIQSNYLAVPDVSNMSRSQAIAKLENANLQVDPVVVQTTSKTVSKGQVVRTNPSAGDRVRKGTTVKLIVSTGGQTIRFGDYTDADYSTTATQLTAQGFTVKKTMKSSNDVPSGKIISQSIDAGTAVDPNTTTVTFVVSSGPAKVTVPDFTGQDQSVVETWKNNHNITVNYTYIASEKPRNQVISQSQKANSKMSSDQTLEVTLSDGSEASSSNSSPSNNGGGAGNGGSDNNSSGGSTSSGSKSNIRTALDLF